jgi:hypothetical protein
MLHGCIVKVTVDLIFRPFVIIWLYENYPTLNGTNVIPTSEIFVEDRNL